MNHQSQSEVVEEELARIK